MVLKTLRDIFDFCDKKDLSFLILLAFLIVLSGLLELVGVGSLFPYIKLLNEPSLIETNKKVKWVYDFFRVNSYLNFMILFGFVVFFMIVLKAALTFLNNYLQSRFSANLLVKVSKSFLNGFVNTSYDKIITLNSSQLSKHLINDCQAIQNIVKAVLTLVTDLLQAIILVSLLLYAAPPIVWLVISSVAILIYLTFVMTRTKLKQIGQNKELFYRYLYRSAYEILQGIKDIKIYQAKSTFTNRFFSARELICTYEIKRAILTNIPTLVFNVMGFGTIIAVILSLLMLKGDIKNALPALGVIAFTLQRLMPVGIRINSSLANIRSSIPNINVVKDLMEKTFDNTFTSPIKERTYISFYQLKLRNVSYCYPGSEQNALCGVNFKLQKHEILGIVGHSGAGKSTLVDVLLGFLTIKEGEIYLNGALTKGKEVLRGLVGYVPQQTIMLDNSIRANVAFGIPENEIDENQVWHCLEVAQLKQFVMQLPDRLNTTIGDRGIKLSGGQRQRIGIARALYRDPEVIIMDEATNELDSKTEREFNRALRQLMGKKTLVIIAHRLSSVKFCDRIIVMKDGYIVDEGHFEDLKKHSSEFQAIYSDLVETW